jgi:sulfur carrier protein
MLITVNGQERDTAPGRTLLDLVQEMNLDPSVVVAELNRDIVPGPRFSTTPLNAGDNLELLSFVGGG